MSEHNPRPLAKKIAEVMAAVSRVPKRGVNDFHKYRYAKEEDIFDAIRDELGERGVAVVPSVVHYEVDNRSSQSLATVKLEVALIDGESGDTITSYWIGQGMDAGDKAFYKAYTGALKYWAMKQFLISTGDDPESDAEVDRGAYGRANSRSRPRRSSGRGEATGQSTGQPTTQAAAPSANTNRPKASPSREAMLSKLHMILDKSGEEKAQQDKALGAYVRQSFGVEALDELSNDQIVELGQLLVGMKIKPSGREKKSELARWVVEWGAKREAA